MTGFSGTTREKRRTWHHRLAMDKVRAITTLHSLGVSERRIGKTLNISRKAVRRHLGRTPSKDAKAPTGEAPTGSAASKDTKAPTGPPLHAARRLFRIDLQDYLLGCQPFGQNKIDALAPGR